MTSLTVHDVALRSAVTVPPDASIAQAEQLLIEKNASDLYVIDSQERLLGVVPDYEILKHRLIDGDGSNGIASLMSPVKVWLVPTASLEAGAILLREHVHASVPVVDGGRLIGQLCRVNLLRILAEARASAAAEPLPSETYGVSPPKFLRTAQTSIAAPA